MTDPTPQLPDPCKAGDTLYWWDDISDVVRPAEVLSASAVRVVISEGDGSRWQGRRVEPSALAPTVATTGYTGLLYTTPADVLRARIRRAEHAERRAQAQAAYARQMAHDLAVQLGAL